MTEDDLDRIDRNRRHFLTVATVVTGVAGAGAASARGFGEFDLRDDFQDNKVPPGAEPEYNGGVWIIDPPD